MKNHFKKASKDVVLTFLYNTNKQLIASIDEQFVDTDAISLNFSNLELKKIEPWLVYQKTVKIMFIPLQM